MQMYDLLSRGASDVIWLPFDAKRRRKTPAVECFGAENNRKKNP